MKRCLHFFVILFCLITSSSNSQPTLFETSQGTQSATYAQTIAYYQHLDKASPQILLKEMGPTDAGINLHLVLFSSDEKFDPKAWHQQGKVVVMVNNGIHAGEPDGIDASMMFIRDLANGKIKAPPNVVFGIIPVYNIGGCLNRGTSRANQNGPLEYGFRGNSQNLDLNRDFTKNDSKEARSFAQIFHYLDPHILIDNHVSDGADYQHTMTLLTTQYNKLGPELGNWLKKIFEPSLYKSMSTKGWDMCPYVDFGNEGPDKGMTQFSDPPRFCSGFGALWQCISFVPETHMLKPYKDRVTATYAFMQTITEQASQQADAIFLHRGKARAALMEQQQFPLDWQVDTTQFDYITFKGFGQAYKPSGVTGLPRMYYDRSQPYTKQVKFFNEFKAINPIKAPAYYIVPQGWYSVIELLKINGVQMKPLPNDTSIAVTAYHIDDYQSLPAAYEKHHKNSAVKTTDMQQTIRFLKGDYLIPTQQPAKRYLVEMLEPTGDDSFFAWNFFDGILQQKEGYSDYRWDDVAAAILEKDATLKAELNAKKQSDAAFAADVHAQLDFVYKHSSYYEAGHLRYPVYRIL